MNPSAAPEATGMLTMLGRLIREERRRTQESHIGRLASLLALATLVGAIPTDVRVRTINQVVTIAAPELLEHGPLVDEIEHWPGGNANEFLTVLKDLAINEAKRTFAARPERALAYRNYRRRFGFPDLIGVDTA